MDNKIVLSLNDYKNLQGEPHINISLGMNYERQMDYQSRNKGNEQSLKE